MKKRKINNSFPKPGDFDQFLNMIEQMIGQVISSEGHKMVTSTPNGKHCCMFCQQKYRTKKDLITHVSNSVESAERDLKETIEIDKKVIYDEEEGAFVYDSPDGRIIIDGLTEEIKQKKLDDIKNVVKMYKDYLVILQDKTRKSKMIINQHGFLTEGGKKNGNN